jgi:hypothetical protein
VIIVAATSSPAAAHRPNAGHERADAHLTKDFMVLPSECRCDQSIGT